MSLTRIDADDDESTVLVIEGSGAMVATALPLVGQLVGVQDVAVTVSAGPRPAEEDGRDDVTPAEQAEDGDKPKRTRRTKAQIEADKQAAQTPTLPAQPAVPSFPAQVEMPHQESAAAPGWSPFGSPAAAAPAF